MSAPLTFTMTMCGIRVVLQGLPDSPLCQPLVLYSFCGYDPAVTHHEAMYILSKGISQTELRFLEGVNI
jgi:hypothetical protein